MNLSYYNEEVDKLLWDALEDDCFMESELPNMVDTLSQTIYQYNKDLSLEKLKSLIQYLIEQKYKKYYIYDLESEFNQVKDTKNISDKQKKSPDSKKVSPAKPDAESEMMTVTMSDINDGDDIEVVSVSCSQAKYINSEIGSEVPDKVQVSSPTDLISHRHDHNEETFNQAIYIKRQKRIVEIKKIPQHEQKSAEWLAQRQECLTATAVATALDEDPYKYPAELLLDKCERGKPFVENENVHHGKKYEQVGTMFYQFRNNIKVAEYGLLQHDKYKFIGASPDGICEKMALHTNKLSKLVGRLLEIKFPKTRKILTEGKLDGDICPHYYFVQVQTQLFVTKMDECDFMQSNIEEYDSWEDYVKDSVANIPGLSKKTNLEKGCLIQLLPKKMAGGDPDMCLYNAKYIYPPRLHMTHEEIEKWIAHEVLNFHMNDLSKDYLIDQIIFWRLTQVACHLIKANTSWFESKIPQLKQFWDYVLFYRKNPKKLDRLVKLVEETGVKNSALIFERVHKDYKSANPDTKYQPLYQEESEWRKIYNKKYANYQKFTDYKNKSTLIKKKVVKV